MVAYFYAVALNILIIICILAFQVIGRKPQLIALIMLEVLGIVRVFQEITLCIETGREERKFFFAY